MNVLDKVYNLTVDIKNIDTKYNSYAKFFDDDRETSVIKVKILNNNSPIDLENCSVEAYFVLANNTYHNETCKIINSSEGIVELQLCQKCLVKGENIVRLSILKDNEIANTPIITYEVRKGLYSDNPNFNDDPLTPILSQMLLDVKVTKVNQIELQERYEKSLPKIEGKIKEVESLINRVDTAIASGTQDLEVKEARVDKNGKSYAKLGDRLDEVDSQLEQIKNEKISISKFTKSDTDKDDTVRFEKALAYCELNKKALFIPSGTYNLSSTLLINSNMKIEGESRESVILNFTDVTDCIKFNGSSDVGCYNSTIENLLINGTNLECNGVNFNYARESMIKNIKIKNCDIGINLNLSWSNGIHNSIIEQNTTNISLGLFCNDVNFFDCEFSKALGNGIVVIDDAQQVGFFGCSIQKNKLNGVLIRSGRSISFNGCYIEENNMSNINDCYDINIIGDVKKATGISFNGCIIWSGNSTASIYLDSVSSVFLNGCTIMKLGASNTVNSVATTSNTNDVNAVSCYSENLAIKDDGNCVNDTRTPKFSKDLSVVKDYANLKLITKTSLRDAKISFWENDTQLASIGTYGNQLVVKSANKSTGNVDNIIIISENNDYIKFYSSLDMTNEDLININRSTAKEMSLIPTIVQNNNTIFIDSTDGKLKFKDGDGIVRLINVS